MQRIIALLLSLADLAERSSQRSTVICHLILWLLKPAEMAASILVDPAYDTPPAELDPTGDVRMNALRLAWRLRELACIIAYQAGLAERAAGESIDRCLPETCAIANMIFVIDFARPAHDTS